MFTALKLRVLEMAVNRPERLALTTFVIVVCAVPASLTLIF